MKRKLNMPILGLFVALEEISSTARGKINQWGFTAKGKTKRPQQTPANPDKKAHRKMVEASKRRNRK